GEINQRQEITQSAGLVEHLTQCDAMTVVGKLGNILADIVVERQKSLLLCQHDGCRCELFRHRGHVEDGSGRKRTAGFEAGLSVRLGGEKSWVMDEAQRASGRAGLVVSGEESVDLLCP